MRLTFEQPHHKMKHTYSQVLIRLLPILLCVQNVGAQEQLQLMPQVGPAGVKCIAATDGMWVLSNIGALTQKLTRFDASNIPQQSWELDLEGTQMAWLDGLALADGGLLLVNSEATYDMDSEQHFITVSAMRLSDNGTVAWQKRFHRPTASQPVVYGAPTTMSEDALGNIFISVAREGYNELVRISGSSVNLWLTTEISPGEHGFIPDDQGGIFALRNGLGKVEHILSDGSIGWSKHLDYPTRLVHAWCLDRCPDGNLRVTGGSNGAYDGFVVMTEWTTDGNLVGEWNHGPVNPLFYGNAQTLLLDNGLSLVVQAGNRSEFIVVDEDHHAVSAFRASDQLNLFREVDGSNASIMMSGLVQDSEDATIFTPVIWKAQEDMSDYCGIEPFSIGSHPTQVDTLTVVTDDAPYVEFFSSSEEPWACTVSPATLLATDDFCASLFQLLTSVPTLETTEVARIAPTLCEPGSLITILVAQTTRIEVFSSSGVLMGEPRLVGNGTSTLRTDDLMPGLYLVRCMTEDGRPLATLRFELI